MMPDFWKSAELRNCHRINWERYLNQTFQLAPWPSRNLLHICKPLRSPDRKPRVSRFSSLSQKLLLVRLFIYLVYFLFIFSSVLSLKPLFNEFFLHATFHLLLQLFVSTALLKFESICQTNYKLNHSPSETNCQYHAPT